VTAQPAGSPSPPAVTVDQWLRKRRIAVCGATPKRDRWGYRVFRRLVDEGYDAIPVHPIAKEIDGIPVYPALGEIPGGVEAVSVITPPLVSTRIVAEAAEIGKPPCWFQPGASSREALAEARRLGVATIDGPCVLIELDARGGRPRGNA
jgi:predicted CoA-binding protein